ncbi:MAG: ABC transporter ATP-binding protein [Pseudoalteromonas sp.]|uniref:ABC transporter ATP-binding protein n=1 Tax=unclassified Pseudoalteromonas TaxID=194690 RepID=UPI000C07D713|nr:MULTISPECIES: ABC transporter ATP-binding protein [unclassified Pseudoalteromonas]MDB2355753.1 ABC transporter ATP-binding protein [Pseudoalteromonas sp.]MDP2633961.1 ABC transporter ATP-binding protein [Pseudoalteromonas sp. 1_MG-2023]PHN90804.1 ABC transporter [Pseudoalteromonas sp. 3D05]
MSEQTTALKIKGLRKVYKNGVEAVKNIDLQVQKGDFFALLGPNGAGKSTTIGVISSLVNKTAGQVEVFGHNIDTHLEAAKSELGLVPQEFNFSQFETLTQILVNQAGYYGVPRKIAHQRADKYLEQLGLLEKKDKQARTLSGGMKRRLMIARALMHEPKLLILDEPTAGVDIELRRSMWDFLRQINEQGVTIILTTHYLEEAELLCKNIAIIDSGIIVENTTIKALLAKLDKETFILDLKQPVQPVSLEGYQFSMVDDHTIEVEVAKSQGLNAVFSALTEQGNTVLSMRNKANRLEELFVGLLEQGREK